MYIIDFSYSASHDHYFNGIFILQVMYIVYTNITYII